MAHFVPSGHRRSLAKFIRACAYVRIPRVYVDSLPEGLGSFDLFIRQSEVRNIDEEEGRKRVSMVEVSTSNLSPSTYLCAERIFVQIYVVYFGFSSLTRELFVTLPISIMIIISKIILLFSVKTERYGFI